jgi:hypothetical protein
MAISRGRGVARCPAESDIPDSGFTFPTGCLLETTEQMRRFELLRLAFFVLKLRKLDGRVTQEASLTRGSKEEEREFRRNLLRHAIFQQVLTLTRLDAREQALQIIAACRQ